MGVYFFKVMLKEQSWAVETRIILLEYKPGLRSCGDENERRIWGSISGGYEVYYLNAAYFF
jgi:hypothetical protein